MKLKTNGQSKRAEMRLAHLDDEYAAKGRKKGVAGDDDDER